MKQRYVVLRHRFYEILASKGAMSSNQLRAEVEREGDPWTRYFGRGRRPSVSRVAKIAQSTRGIVRADMHPTVTWHVDWRWITRPPKKGTAPAPEDRPVRSRRKARRERRKALREERRRRRRAYRSQLLRLPVEVEG